MPFRLNIEVPFAYTLMKDYSKCQNEIGPRPPPSKIVSLQLKNIIIKILNVGTSTMTP